MVTHCSTPPHHAFSAYLCTFLLTVLHLISNNDLVILSQQNVTHGKELAAKTGLRQWFCGIATAHLLKLTFCEKASKSRQELTIVL